MNLVLLCAVLGTIQGVAGTTDSLEECIATCTELPSSQSLSCRNSCRQQPNNKHVQQISHNLDDTTGTGSSLSPKPYQWKVDSKERMRRQTSRCGIPEIYKEGAKKCMEENNVLLQTDTSTRSFDGMIDIYRIYGVLEPYAYMVYSAFLESWASKKASSDLPDQIGNISDFLSSKTLKTVLEDHCSLVQRLADCVEGRMRTMCSVGSTAQDFSNLYREKFKLRYCYQSEQNYFQVKPYALNALMNASKFALVEPFLGYWTIDDNLPMRIITTPEFNTIQEYVQEYCNMALFREFLQKINSGPDDYILEAAEDLVKYGKDPARCIIRIVQKLFPRLDIPSLIDQYVEHIHLASGGIIDVDQDYFLTLGDYDVNYGSEERVSVMAIGDPHVLHLNASNFSLCNSPGETLFFSSFVRHRVVLKGVNSKAANLTNATVISSVELSFYNDGAYLTADSSIKFAATNGSDLHLVHNRSASLLSVSSYYDNSTKSVVVIDKDIGLMISVMRFKDFYNIIMRASQEYLATGSGLLVHGCGDEAMDPKKLLSTISSRQKRDAGADNERCEQVCSGTPTYLQESCIFDCVALEDVSVAEVHYQASQMRIALRRQDEQIRRYVANFFFYSTTTTEQMPFISDDLVTTATQSTTLRPATQSTTLRPATSTTLRPVTSSTLRPATNTDGTTTEKKTTDNDQVTAGPQSTTLKPATNTDGLTTEKKTTNNEPTESLDVLNSTILSEQGLNGEDKNGCQVFVPAGVILNVLLSLAIHF